MKELKINNYSLKLMSIGRCIFLDNNENANKLKKYLILKKVNFFTHPTAELHDMLCNELKTILKGNYNITCMDVKKIAPTGQNRNNVFYILYLMVILMPAIGCGNVRKPTRIVRYFTNMFLINIYSYIHPINLLSSPQKE